jgi:hypothetical protein
VRFRIGITQQVNWSFLKQCDWRRAILLSMQPPASSQPSPSLSGFAGLLATLTAPKAKPDEDKPLWSVAGLDDDIATISYESALRTHARYRPPDRDSERDIARLAARVDAMPMMSDDSVCPAAKDAASAPKCAMPGRDLRKASITIRLSKAECAQLHQRAADAGLTVSAYLRSCVLEAEALRAQVKQALAELKQGNEGPREQGNGRAENEGGALNRNDGMRLTRVLRHIGRFWTGRASSMSS